MAIKIAIITPYGIDLPDAYLKINFFTGDNRHISYHVRSFATEKARRDELQHFDEKSFSFEYVPGQGDVLAACYKDLMSRPEYTKATAV